MKKILLLLFFFSFWISCDDFGGKILEQKPENAVTEANAWENENDLEKAFGELYARFRYCFGNVVRRTYRDRGLLFDFQGSFFVNTSKNLLEKSFNVRSSFFSWENEYNIISQANQILNGIKISSVSREKKDICRGQALTIRAYTYFYIIQTWGDAPLVTEDFLLGQLGKTSWKDIADYIIRDLKEAAGLLPGRSRMPGAICNQIPAKGTAHAILAHVCAWKGSLNNEPELLREGITAATEVIEKDDYELAADPHEVVDKVLKGNSREGIFEIAFYDLKGESNNWAASMAGFCETYPVIPNTLPQTPRWNFRLSNEKAKEVFNTCGKWFDEIFYEYDEMALLPPSANQEAAYIWKFRHIKEYEDGPSVGQIRIFDMNEILIRLADIILLRGEMRAKTGDLAGAERDLNRIRERCGASLYSVAEGDLSEAIFHQREQELFLEGLCRRYYDIVRNGLDYVHKYLPGRFQDAKGLEELWWPVSYKAFDQNPLMEQNPYWNRFIQFQI